MDCIFCKIANKEIPSTIVYEDEDIIAFNDVNPEAPVHILVIPKKHIASLEAAQPEDAQLLGKILLTIQHIAREFGTQKPEDGYQKYVKQECCVDAFFIGVKGIAEGYPDNVKLTELSSQ